MYEYFEGIIQAVTPAYIVIDVHGIGFRLLVANPYHFEAGEQKRVYVQLIIRDNDQTLYGFEGAADKRTFNQLLTVTGIGPKSALAILANVSSGGLATAIAQDDVKFLTKFPGIGKKSAAQIILDLKGKITTDGQPAAAAIAPVASDVDSELADALAALVALGYPQRTVDGLTDTLKAFSAKTTDAYLREGLRLLSGKA